MGRARDSEEDSRDVQDTRKACGHSHTDARKVSEQQGEMEYSDMKERGVD